MIRAGLRRLGSLALSYARRFGPRALILVYHRIAETEVDPWRLSVSAEHFAEHLAILHKHWNPISLRQLVEAQQRGRIPDRSVVVTFDDGYSSYRHIVQPLLERFQAPATFFIMTGQLDSRREYWWDELEGLLTQPGRLPSRLSIEVDGKHHDLDLIESEYTEAECLRDRKLWAWEGQSGTRLAVYFTLWDLLRRAHAEEQSRVMDALLAWAGKSAFCRPEHRPLSEMELQELPSSGLVEIGAHTVTHPLLTQLPDAQQRQEVVGSKLELEQVLGRPVDSFAFPYGIPTESLVDHLEEMGIHRACSAAGGPVRRRTNRFLLPRETVCDCDGEAFSRQLDAWHR